MDKLQSTKKYLLPIDDGYGWGNIDCFNRPVSMIMGNYGKDFYNTYLFYVCFFHSFFVGKWYPYLFENEEFPQKSFQEFYNDFLKEKFGIEFCVENVGNEEDFHEKVRKNIDLGNTVVVPCDIFNLYYYYNYKTEHIEHYFTIDGYDSQKQVYHILDTLHVDLARDAKYGEFYIKYDEIYKLMKEFFLGLTPKCENKFFWYFKEVSKSNYKFTDCKNEYLALISDILNSKMDYKYVEIEAIKYIKNAIKNDDLSYVDSNIERIFRRSNYKTIYYDMLLELLLQLKVDSESILRVKSLTSDLFSRWDNIRKKIVYETLNKSYNFHQLDVDIEGLVQSENDFLRKISDIIK